MKMIRKKKGKKKKISPTKTPELTAGAEDGGLSPRKMPNAGRSTLKEHFPQ